MGPAKRPTVLGETCPQYLVLTERDLDDLNMEGAKCVCSPPVYREPRPYRSGDGIAELNATMFALLFFFLTLLAPLFQSTSRLERKTLRSDIS
jgi:hypothetical protein